MSVENAQEILTNSPKKGKKYFSLEEANRALPYVTRIVTEITDCYQQAVGIRQQLEQDDNLTNPEVIQDDYEKKMDHLNDLLDELQQVGVELKDFEKGLLDFPALHEGREIYLCWHQGEQSIQAWHEIETGYAGRQDVSLLEEVH